MKHYLHSLGVLSALAVAFPALAAEPVAPSGVTAASTEAGVVITWQPVTEDVDENPVDPDEVIYDVYRCDADDVRPRWPKTSSRLPVPTCWAKLPAKSSTAGR